MSGIWRCKKLRDIASVVTSRTRFSSLVMGPVSNLNYLSIGRRQSFIGIQERYKWDHGGESCRKIMAQGNCPRCSKHMDLLFSSSSSFNISPPVPTVDSGGYQAVNICPNCKSVYYFRPHRTAPLQGSFVEIGINASNNNNGYKRLKKISGGGGKVSFWDTLRSYGGELTQPGNGNGLAVPTPPGPPFAPGVDVVRAMGPSNGGGSGGGKNN